MNLHEFRRIVDRTPARIVVYRDDILGRYTYLGLDFQRSYNNNVVSDALYERIRNAFKSGHREAWYVCRSLKTDLIREHVIEGVPLEPYFDVLAHLQDALRTTETGEVIGDWASAVQAAQDHMEIGNFRPSNHSHLYAREFAVAKAAKFLKQQGYDLRLEPGFIALEERAERSLVRKIEKLVDRLGGLNVLQKIFAEISPLYDGGLQRYQIVPHISMTGGGVPQKPWGYLLQLAVKHISNTSGKVSLHSDWPQLLNLSTAYAAVIDVQPYVSTAFGSFDAEHILGFFREQALYDSIFRFPQLRTSDILKLCRGMLSFLDFDDQLPEGWTLTEVFEVIEYLIAPIRNVRGPVMVSEQEVCRALPHMPEGHIVVILRDVLAHPIEGPNRSFSKPTDAPTPDDRSKGSDFYLKPLIRCPDNRYLIADRSVCGWGYLEALLTALRPHHKQFDDHVGSAIEGFLKEQLQVRGIPTLSGDYNLEGEHGECDIVADTPQTLIFMELKKKALTRRAQAGSDADLLLDLAGSLLAAQAQAGWHELRITTAGSLDLLNGGKYQTLSLLDRGIEKIAVSMLDFGSFQDRIMLKQFMEATLNANFSSSNAEYNKRFKVINEALQEIRDQYTAAHKGKAEIHQPFFNCWFISIPQLLILLDEVTDADSFRGVLWSYRHMTTGTSDLYFEISNMRRMKATEAQNKSS